MGGVSHCCLFHYLDSWTEAAVWTSVACHSCMETSPWATILTFLLTKDLSRAFLMQISLTVLPPDFLNSSGISKHDAGSHFYQHFGNFSSLTAVMTQFVPVIGRVLSWYASSTCWLCTALMSAATKMHASVIARTGWGGVCEVVESVLPAKRLIGAPWSHKI